MVEVDCDLVIVELGHNAGQLATGFLKGHHQPGLKLHLLELTARQYLDIGGVVHAEATLGGDGQLGVFTGLQTQQRLLEPLRDIAVAEGEAGGLSIEVAVDDLAILQLDGEMQTDPSTGTNCHVGHVCSSPLVSLRLNSISANNAMVPSVMAQSAILNAGK